MKKIREGIAFFQTNIFPSYRELFGRPTLGQSPKLLFITCSDSRIDPNLITHTEPGELAVSRNVGNIVPPSGTVHSGEYATIEYAVRVLGIQHIVVCGHTDCGAMKALLDRETFTDLPELLSWLSYGNVDESLLRCGPNKDGQSTLRQLIEANVLAQLGNLVTYPIVSSRVTTGQLQLHGWLYEIDSGRILAYSADRGIFLPLI